MSSSVRALVGENQVLGLCELNSWTEGLYQLVEVLRVVVVSRVVEEWAVFVKEVLFMLTMYELGKLRIRLENAIPSVATS